GRVGNVFLKPGPKIIPVEMNLEGLPITGATGFALVGNTRFACSSQQSGKEVFVRSDTIENGAWLDHPWPSDHCRYSDSTLPIGGFFTPEGRRAPIRPAKRLGTIVSAPDDDGIIGNA